MIILDMVYLDHDPRAHAAVKIIKNSVLKIHEMLETDAPRILRTPISFILLIMFRETRENKPVAERRRAMTPRKAYIDIMLWFGSITKYTLSSVQPCC